MLKSVKNKLLSTMISKWWYIQHDYSLEGEDLLLKTIFYRLKQKKGFYVDVGCFHPYYISNLALLHNKGWSGINIDANPDTIELFNKHRKNDININMGIGLKKGLLKYNIFDKNIESGAASTNSFDEAFTKGRLDMGAKIIETKDVNVDTLENILDKYLPMKQEIDIMDIDVEGMDFEVIQSNNWNKYKPKVVLIEFGEFLPLEDIFDTEIFLFMKEQNYILLQKTPRTGIFVRDDIYNIIIKN